MRRRFFGSIFPECLEFGYRFDGKACGKGVTVCVLGVWSSFPPFDRLVVTDLVLTTAPLDDRKSELSDEG